MKEIQLVTTLNVYPKIEALPTSQGQLLAQAKAALQDAYAPYSRFYVGAAVLLENGVIIKGSNQENASYPLCLCAERTALAAAASLHAGVPIVAMAVTVKNPNKLVTQPAAPCGACRQVIVETESRYQHDIQLILHGETGEVYTLKSGKALLPLYFTGAFL